MMRRGPESSSWLTSAPPSLSTTAPAETRAMITLRSRWGNLECFIIKTEDVQVKTSSLTGGEGGIVMFRSFEMNHVYSVGEGTVEMNHFHHNGLDGKISRVEISVFKKDGIEETIRVL